MFHKNCRTECQEKFLALFWSFFSHDSHAIAEELFLNITQYNHKIYAMNKR